MFDLKLFKTNERWNTFLPLKIEIRLKSLSFIYLHLELPNTMAKRILLVTLKSIGIFFECFIALIVVYFICYWTLSRIPINSDVKTKTAQHTIVYLTSNGVHTDFVVPIVNHQKDWGKELKLSKDFEQDSTRNWIAIGWGDKNFFLKTKNWDDLTVGTALKATFGLGTG